MVWVVTIGTFIATVIILVSLYYAFTSGESWMIRRLSALTGSERPASASSDQFAEKQKERIQEALASTSLLFIGYRMADWDFRVLLHGILSATTKSLRRLSISVQLAPEFQDEDKCSKAQCYLESYFGEIQVRVYWGTAREFAGKLRELWHGTRAATVSG